MAKARDVEDVDRTFSGPLDELRENVLARVALPRLKHSAFTESRETITCVVCDARYERRDFEERARYGVELSSADANNFAPCEETLAPLRCVDVLLVKDEEVPHQARERLDRDLVIRVLTRRRRLPAASKPLAIAAEIGSGDFTEARDSHERERVALEVRTKKLIHPCLVHFRLAR